MPALLARCWREPYFAAPPPKSTGRDLFHAAWLDRLLARHGRARAAVDVQATLVRTDAHAASPSAAAASMPAARELLVVCGGGAFNGELMRDSARCCRAVSRMPTAERGLPPLQVEAVAFAWLARATSQRAPAIVPAVTGARGPRVLGALYPALKAALAAKDKGRPWAAFSAERSDQAEKLDPQPQVVVAFGFLITNCAPCRSSL